jgi:hypothetical protein
VSALAAVQLALSGALAATLALSGWTKVRRPLPAALAMVRFGLSRRVESRRGVAAGLIELAIAAALLASLSPVGPGAAATLGCLFIIITARALARGERFVCACFGGREQLSYRTLLRAGLLFASAVCVFALSLTNEGSIALGGRVVALSSGVLAFLAATLLLALAAVRPFAMRMRPAVGET